MISITKTAMWVTIVAVITGTVQGSADAATLAGLFSASSLYAFRRYVFWKTGQLGTDGRPAFGRGALDDEDDNADSRRIGAG